MEHRSAALLGLAGILYCTKSIGLPLKAATWFGAWLSTGGRRWLHLFRHTWRRDANGLFGGIKMLCYLHYFKLANINVVTRFRTVVSRAPDEVEDYSNMMANYFLGRGYKKGDSVALFMINRPEWIITWLGLVKIGVIPALINCSIRKKQLLHTTTVANCRAMIYGLELESAVEEIHEEIVSTAKGKFEFFNSRHGAELAESVQSTLEGSIRLDDEVRSCPDCPEPKSVSDSIGIHDTINYVYTSGTTGMPKACLLSHLRLHLGALSSTGVMSNRPSDVIYMSMPLYHSAALALGMGMAFGFGSKTIVRKKFSARNFFKDCAKYKVTSAIYIGEMCRYLLTTPESPWDKNHGVKRLFGNGLKGNVWKEFVERFGISDIKEFYAASEGNCNVTNTSGEVGKVGWIGVTWPRVMREKLYPIFLVKIDEITGEPVRGDDGNCVECLPGEPGEMVGKIVRGDPIKDFKGYKDATATNKKVLSNVLKKGDLFFRSGDILIMDELGFLTFKDRLGDTFRWQGENVSTSEVEAIITSMLNLTEPATVYGVEVPHAEGKAGMVAIPEQDENENHIDLEDLYKGCMEQLPKFARPLFVRFTKEAQLTSTFKRQKQLLRKEGFDLAAVTDPLFFMDAESESFVALDHDLHRRIEAGQVRLT